VLRGASQATAAALAHARYRNFFEPHRRDIFAGFRSVRAADDSTRSAV
jgi:formylglycine-generating enzyme required for sulfatase activity